MNVEPDQVDQARGSAAALERAMGIQFRDSSLLGVALTHRSTLNEHPELSLEDNERLEFLGDAVIGAVVADQLYQAFPAETEGALTLMRAQLVRQSGLARWARDLDLGRYLVLGRGEDRRGGRERDGLLSSAFEALVGAIYLDRGFAAAQEMLMPLVAESLPSLSPSTGGLDAKSELQHRVQAQFRSLPVYEVVSVEGPEHRPTFTVAVAAEGGVAAQGVGASKHAAEQDAAQRALEVWDAQHSDPADHPCT
jgi:ribonuclease-3